jgi:hypothetical protein
MDFCMFTWRDVTISLTVTLVLGSSALGAEKEILLQLSGKQVSGGFNTFDPSTGLVLNASFSPATLLDGTEGVFAAWSACVQPPPPAPPLCLVNAAGIAPASSIQVKQGNTVEVDFDATKLILVFLSTGPSTWKGSFKPHKGLFSFAQETTGNQVITNVTPGFPDPAVTWTIVQQTSGNRQQWSANFAGTLGPHSVQVLPASGNGNLFIHNGGVALIRTSTP